MIRKNLVALVTVCSLLAINSIPAMAESSIPEEFQPLIEQNGETVSISLNDGGLYTEIGMREATDTPAISVTTNGNDGIYRSQEGQYFSKLSTGEYMEVGKIDVDISNAETIAAVVNTYGLSQATADHLNDLREKNISEDGKVAGVSVFTANALSTRATRYYIGYADRRYREELTKSYYQGGPATVYRGNVESGNSHLKKRVADVFKYILGTAIDSKTYGAFSLVDLGFSLIDTSHVPVGAVAEHSATLYTESNEKITLATEGTNEFLGSITHKGSFYFSDTYHPGYGQLNQTRNTPTRYYETDNFNNADRKAYENYMNSPWYETPQAYVHFNVSFNVN